MTTDLDAHRIDRLHRACRAVADNIAEFDTVTDSELLDDLERALDGLADPQAPAPAPASQRKHVDLLETARRVNPNPSPEFLAEQRLQQDIRTGKGYAEDNVPTAPAPARADAGLREKLAAFRETLARPDRWAEEDLADEYLPAALRQYDELTALLAQHPTPPAAGAGAEAEELLREWGQAIQFGDQRRQFAAEQALRRAAQHLASIQPEGV